MILGKAVYFMVPSASGACEFALKIFKVTLCDLPHSCLERMIIWVYFGMVCMDPEGFLF